ncbi:hypothetical protein KAFR_0B05410 [Kazachstania africana CBS 2517]|uniref:Protein kinase domain-containing protein n=1 Tax=Kazachstania africana (strain ATCC 22294 / BCRC 22015 / CBS 2517 / CECT 1963 / NBRC 1671 / NRRL Y-8276) TaxID=1071382 RepID=H2AR36_KAZAF|nr:hypothetical protein KAFR_0B05410 [Kazachstania africana CBS 2517]CCF56836.1 hypothetical protein KAFR_0B05410 [Kazachstania africana CBS 2517]
MANANTRESPNDSDMQTDESVITNTNLSGVLGIPQRTDVTASEENSGGRIQLGEWIFSRTLGKGAKGTVKLAKHRASGQICAVKITIRYQSVILNKCNTQNIEDVKCSKEFKTAIQHDRRTMQEFQLSRVLRHPHICKFYKMEEMRYHYYMFLEYIQGCTLLEYVSSQNAKKLNEEIARDFAGQILNALAYLHSNNIVHRDLKMENIMVTNEDKTIKLIDFGLGCFYDQNSTLNDYCGSLYYAAPEVLKRDYYIGPEVDIWSFGVVLYIMVTGKLPFKGRSKGRLMKHILSGQVKFPNFLSMDVISLLSRILEIDLSFRFSLSDIIKHQWFWICDIKYWELIYPMCKREKITEYTISFSVLSEMRHLNFIFDIDETYDDLCDIVTEWRYLRLADISQYIVLDYLWDPKGNENLLPYAGSILGYHPLISKYYLVRDWMHYSEFSRRLCLFCHDRRSTDIDKEFPETYSLCDDYMDMMRIHGDSKVFYETSRVTKRDHPLEIRQGLFTNIDCETEDSSLMENHSHLSEHFTDSPLYEERQS